MNELAMDYRPAPSRFGRLVRSQAFAWAVSISVHAVIFLVFYQMVLRDEVPVRRLIIPEARLAPPGGSPVPADGKPLKLSGQSAPPTAARAPQAADLPVAAVTLDQATALALPGLDLPDAGASATSTLASSLTSSGTPRVGTGAPVSNFFGQTGNAYKVVYIVDVSASLMIYIDEIIREMRESIQALIPTQRFHIILARPLRVEELRYQRLVPAIAQYTKEANLFLDTIDRIPKPGKADPIEAMKRAFAVHPELIYFLSDGDYPDVAGDLERAIDRLNADRSVCITTIGFDPSPKPRALLEHIARRNNGHFRAVEPK